MRPRKRKLEADDDAEISRKNYQARLKESNNVEGYVRQIVTRMMFSMGDSSNPLQENENFVVDLLKSELIFLLEDIVGLKDDKDSFIDLKDLVFILQKQVGIISRFVSYLQNRIEMSKYRKAKMLSTSVDSEKYYNEKDDEDDDVEEIEELISNKKKKTSNLSADESIMQEMKESIKSLNLNIEVYKNFDDKIFNQKQTLMLESINEMTVEDYTDFTEARRVSFQRNSVPAVKIAASNRRTPKPLNPMQLLLTWIGKPPIRDQSAEVFLAFIAKELVSEIVGAALIERKAEPKNVFRNEGIYPETTLQLRHYEEAIRKNAKFRKYGRIFV